MYARRLALRLKPNAMAEFSKTIETQMIPMLRKQQGFQNEIVLVGENANEVFAISLWEKRENADAYGRTSFPKFEKSLAKVVDGLPQVKTYEVLVSTLPSRPAA
jgi:hypothetical protein